MLQLARIHSFRHVAFRSLRVLRYAYSTGAATGITKEPLSPLAKHLQDSIKITGPMTTAHFMRQVLVNPLSGYYMHSDVFGTQGDFITSPEISQVFGELTGIWYLTEWMRLGKPSKTQFIEFGPGRGTLMSDMLRALQRFPHFYETITGVHLIEASPALRGIQRQTIVPGSSESDVTYKPGDADNAPLTTITRSDGVPIFWHDGIEVVPEQWSLIMAHEFFDALPVHTFEKTNEGWRELLVDIDDTDESERNFRFVLSPAPTASSKAFIEGNERYAQYKVGDRIEISPDGEKIMAQISELVDRQGGTGLIIDYGQNYTQGETIRAIRKHQIVHPLVDPGSADLSADVDFAALAHAASKYSGVKTYTPITQSVFLQSLGVRARLEMLLKQAKSPESRKNLIQGVERLVNPEMMGRIYKVLAFAKETSKDAGVPVGFS